MNRPLLRPRLAVFAALLVIAVCVGIASHPGGELSSISTQMGTPAAVMTQSALWIGVAADAIVLSLLAYALWPRSLRKGAPAKEVQARTRSVHWAIKLAALAIALAPLVIGLVVLVRNRSTKPLAPKVPAGVPIAPAGGGAGTAAGLGSSDAAWIGFAIAVSLVLALFLWLWVRRRIVAGQSSLEPRAALVRALEGSLEELRTIADPRQAVIAAYASMEKAFDRAGLPRRPFETPLEFVARVLSLITRTAAEARRLADLFELAKFSRHDIDERMRSSALESLSRIRDELRQLKAA